MRPVHTLAVLCCAMAATAILVAPVQASYEADADLFPEKAEKYGADLTERYLSLWKQVGPPDSGANLVIDGAPVEEVKAGADRLYAYLHPPEPAPVETTAPDVTSYAPPATSSGGCPASMAGEASSPDAVNPTSGASGCYQVLPSTAAAMGPSCSDVNSTDCLAAICAAQGNDAWVAADPC